MKVFVNGVDCSNMALLDSLSLSDDVGKRSSEILPFVEEMVLTSRAGIVDIFNVEGQHIFGGFAKRPVIRPRGAGDPEIKVKLVDNTDIADRRIVAETYVEELDHTIVKDVYDRYLKEEGVCLVLSLEANSVITTETKTETTQAEFNSGVLSGVHADAGGTLTLEDISDNPPISRIVEDFEDTNYNFDFSGDWYRTSSRAYQGSSSLRSASIEDRENSDMKIELTVRENAIGKFSLFYFVSSEPNGDFFKIYINGVTVLRTSGVEEIWKYFTIDLMPGDYEIYLSYEKDRSSSKGSDRVWVDQMVFEEWEGFTFPSQGERIAPKITSTADVIKTIRIDYDAELLSGTKVEFYYSIDDQETWELAENDVVRRSVNGAEGMYIKAVLSTTDTTKTPSIYEIRYIIETTSGTFVQKAVFNYIKASQALDELCELSGSVWWITADKVLHYVSMDEFKAPWSIDNNSKIKNVGIETDLNEYRNRQYLRAGQDITDLQIERIKGDGEKRTFNLGYKVAQRPVIKLNGVEQTPGIRQVDKNRPFYWSKGEKEITQDESRTPLSATDVLTVEYYGFYPIVVIAEDDEAISEMASRTGDTGIYEAVDENEVIDSSDLALEFANSKLRKYAKINTRITFDTELKGLQAGQLISVNLPDYEISGDFLIKSVKITAKNDDYVTHSVELIDGEDVGGWEQFFKQLARASKTYVIRENEVLIRLAKQAEEIGFSEEMSYQTYACHFLVLVYYQLREAVASHVRRDRVKHTEETGWFGGFEIQVIRGGQLEVIRFPNLITNTWLNTVRSATMSATPMDLQFKYIALGKDDGTILPLAPENTKLGNEVFRKNFAKVETDGLGRVKRTAIIGSAEANFHIKEIGIYAGSTATTTLNTGILVARVFYDRDKDELESINIVRTDIVGEVVNLVYVPTVYVNGQAPAYDSAEELNKTQQGIVDAHTLAETAQRWSNVVYATFSLYGIIPARVNDAWGTLNNTIYIGTTGSEIIITVGSSTVHLFRSGSFGIEGNNVKESSLSVNVVTGVTGIIRLSGNNLILDLRNSELTARNLSDITLRCLIRG